APRVSRTQLSRGQNRLPADTFATGMALRDCRQNADGLAPGLDTRGQIDQRRSASAAENRRVHKENRGTASSDTTGRIRIAAPSQFAGVVFAGLAESLAVGCHPLVGLAGDLLQDGKVVEPGKHTGAWEPPGDLVDSIGTDKNAPAIIDNAHSLFEIDSLQRREALVHLGGLPRYVFELAAAIH